MRPTTILIIEDNRLVLHTVKETLELQGWRVEACEEGAMALRMIESGEHYDLILTDNDLPGVNGLQLIRYARRLPHLRRTPIIMLSASDFKEEALRAGANVFLKKPEDIYILTETVARLLGCEAEGH